MPICYRGRIPACFSSISSWACRYRELIFITQIALLATEASVFVLINVCSSLHILFWKHFASKRVRLRCLFAWPILFLSQNYWSVSQFGVQGPYLATSDELFYNNFVSFILVG